MKRSLVFMGLGVMMVGLAGCSQAESANVPAIDLTNLDETVAPGEDFYAYSTNGWRKNHSLKPEYSRYGSFDILRENNEIRLNDLFQSLSGKTAEKGSVEQKITDLYNMGLDSVRLNAEGIKPVLPYLKRLNAVKDAKTFAAATAEIELNGEGGLWGVYVGADAMDSNTNVLYLDQNGLELGNRDYYLNKENEEIRKGYLAYLEQIFTFAGDPKAKEKAKDAYDFQVKIAGPYWSMVQQRDVEAQYNPMTYSEVCAKYPNIHFAEYFKTLGIGEPEKIIVGQLSYFEALNKILAKTEGKVLRHYLQAVVLSGATGCVSDEYYNASFDFFSRQMSGVQEQKPRWKRAMQVPNSVLGEAVGELYVAKYFPEKDKQNMLRIVKNIQAALSQHVANLDWMGEETKAKAQEKLSAYIIKIGYPDKWKDYSSLEIDPAKSYYENIVCASRWASADMFSKLGQPVDKAEWGMTPQTVNAYYNPTTNEICFPAGILQPPFYNPDADDAVNYGGIGVVISHEMTHGFDDQGRLFDKDGNMHNWWTEEDAEKFKAKAQGLVDQFNAVEIQPGLFANGAATLGENIADQGGLRVSFTAMQNSFNGKHPKPIDGFTAEQRFYLSYGTIWAQNITAQEEARLTLLDVHSLGRNRVNVSVRNLDSFFEAFGIKEGDAMWRPAQERVVIW